MNEAIGNLRRTANIAVQIWPTAEHAIQEMVDAASTQDQNELPRALHRHQNHPLVAIIIYLLDDDIKERIRQSSREEPLEYKGDE